MTDPRALFTSADNKSDSGFHLHFIKFVNIHFDNNTVRRYLFKSAVVVLERRYDKGPSSVSNIDAVDKL